MLKNFEYRNISYKKVQEGDYLIVKGEIINCSGKNYNSVVFRIILFIRSIPIANVIFTINGFYNGQTRIFEKRMEELNYNKVVSKITQCEIYPESAY